MTTPWLTIEEGQRLVALARWALDAHFRPDDRAVNHSPDVTGSAFREHRGTFVTLTIGGNLRGCIGCLTANEPLADSIPRNALNAALHDPRFPALGKNELDAVRISISVLTPATPLEYVGGDDLINKLRPGTDGVILRKGGQSATFLPQVWDELTESSHFLTALCQKAGLSGSAWRDDSLDISVYQALYFAEGSSGSDASGCSGES